MQAVMRRQTGHDVFGSIRHAALTGSHHSTRWRHVRKILVSQDPDGSIPRTALGRNDRGGPLMCLAVERQKHSNALAVRAMENLRQALEPAALGSGHAREPEGME